MLESEMSRSALQYHLQSVKPGANPRVLSNETTRAAPVRDWEDPVPDIRGARSWLLLSIGSLILAGLFALFLVVGRIPAFAPFITDAGFFKRCLVVHVNLSLLVWFGAFAAAMFRCLPTGARPGPASAALPLALGGVAALCIAAFLPNAPPILSNYVPFIGHPVFAAGVILFLSGLSLNYLHPRLWRPETAVEGDLFPPEVASGLRVCALATLLAVSTFAASWAATSRALPAEVFYERIAWGGGHVLQVANVAAMAAIWLLLIQRLQGRPVVSPTFAALLFGLLLAPHMIAPILTIHGTSSVLYHHGSTQLMRWGIFPVLSVFSILCIRRLLEARRGGRLLRGFWRDARFIGFTLSAGMTICGFILGAMIRDSTTMVPAHYHASIGAITVAFMTMSYLLLPDLGVRIHSSRIRKLVPWQLGAFGIGQMVFAAGFAIGGLYGLDRKAYSSEQHVASFGEHLGLVVMGLGGLLAMVGGILFLILMFAAWRSSRSTNPLETSV